MRTTPGWDATSTGTSRTSIRAGDVDPYEMFFFPLVTEANRAQTVSGLFRLFEYAFICIQIFLGSWFAFRTHLDSSAFKALLSVFFFGFVGDVADFVPWFIALMVIDAMTIGLLVVAIVRRHLTHEYGRVILFIMRYWHGHFFNLFLVPNLMLATLAWGYLGRLGTAGGTVVPIFSLLTTFFSVLHYGVLAPSLMRSPFLSPSAVHAWDPREVTHCAMTFGLLYGSYGLFEDFTDIFALVPPIAACIAAVFFFLRIGLYFPFKSTWPNVVASGVVLSTILGSLLSIVSFFADLPNIVYIVPVIGLAVIIGALAFVFRARRERVRVALGYGAIIEGGQSKPPDSQRQDYFELMNVHTYREAVMHIRIGFEEMCDLFVDWSLLRYLNETFATDTKLLAFSAWLVALFPSEIQLLANFIAQEARFHDVSVGDRCLFFQLHRIHIFRQSLASREASIDFDRVKKLTDETIASFCKVWADLANRRSDFSKLTFFTLAALKNRADSAWVEALDKYPNNPRFLKEHARYLLDCPCQFREALTWNHRAMQVELGHKLQNDKTFHRFVLAFPSYLKSGIVNHRGKLIGTRVDVALRLPQSATESQSSTSSSGSSGADTGDNDTSDEEINTAESNKFLRQSSLRLAFQRALMVIRSHVVDRIKFCALVKFLASALFVVIVFILLVPILDWRVGMFDITRSLAVAHERIFVTGLQPFWIGAMAFVGGLSDGFEDSITAGYDLPPTYLNLDQPESDRLVNLSYAAFADVSALNNALYSTDLTSSDYLMSFGQAYMNSTVPAYVCWPSWFQTGFPYGPELTVGIVAGIIDASLPLLGDQLVTLALNFFTVLADDANERVGLPKLAIYWHWASILHCQTWTMQRALGSYSRTILTSLSYPLQDELAHHIGTYDRETGTAFAGYEDEDDASAAVSLAAPMPAAPLPPEGQKQLKEMYDGAAELTLDFDDSGLSDLVRMFGTVRNGSNATQVVRRHQPRHEPRSLFQTRKRPAPASVLDDADAEAEAEEEEEEEEEEVIEAMDTLLDFLISFTPAILFIFALPSVIFLYTGMDAELDHFASVMKCLNRADCLKASERLSTVAVSKRDKEAAIPSASSISNVGQAWIFVIFSTALVTAVTIFVLVNTRMTASSLDALQEHMVGYALLRAYMYEATRLLGSVIVWSSLPIEGTAFNDTYGGRPAASLYTHLQNRTWGEFRKEVAGYPQTPFRYGNSEWLAGEAVRATEETIELVDKISLGYSEFGPAIGAAAEADAIRFGDRCEVEQVQGSLATYFNCESLERVFGYWMELQSSLAADPFSHTYEDVDLYVLLTLMNTRLAFGFRDLIAALATEYADTYDSFKQVLQLVLIASLVWLFVVFVIEVFLVGSVSNAVLTFRSLLLRVNPVTFVANSQMLALIYGSREIDTHVSSAAHAVFQTSQDALISLNGEGVIESLNPSATGIFGFTPEQMLGQSLKLLVNPENEGNGTLFSTMHLMKTGQAGLVYEASVIGTKDDGTRVPLKMTLLGFATNGRTADSFAVMCKDQTDEVVQKTAVEEAKRQSENLLMQILPKDIIMRLNRGDKNISFTVPSSTILFMDIEKFSSYSVNLTPSELMKNLGEVFTAYDKLLPKFPLVLKIKLIGDDYMAAAGLFNPEVEAHVHANQAVQFTLECLEAIEDLNEQLNASLQVRVGVNTGGPLIAGVLGTDKPLFDIIGDPINVAARLQSTDHPGKVQVSEETYDKIAGGPYEITQRGEIELKGKGKRMTYLVHPRDRK